LSVKTTSEWTTPLPDRLPPLREYYLLIREKRGKGVQTPWQSSKGCRGGRMKAIPVSAKDEAEARPLVGKADAYDAALTALRAETRHW